MSKERLARFKKLFSARRAGTYFMLGAFTLLTATYGAWRLQLLLSPDTGDVGTNERIQLKASDRTSSGSPLPNGLQPPTAGTPYYDYNSTDIEDGPTFLPNNETFRIQGEVYYKDKQ